LTVWLLWLPRLGQKVTAVFKKNDGLLGQEMDGHIAVTDPESRFFRKFATGSRKQ
jgi:hypothetical protein